MKGAQLYLFDEPILSDKTFDYGKGEFKEDVPQQEGIVDDPILDNMMAKLKMISASIENDNKILSEMIDELQKDWTEEEKLQINNPKEYERQQKLKEVELNKQNIMAKEFSTGAIETLKNSTVEGNVVKLPAGQLDRNIYLEVKNSLELIGGKWKGGKVFGFVFPSDPSELLAQIANGEKRNLKKEFQFFATPTDLADELVSYADIHNSHLILEPSAGQGAIINAIHRQWSGVPVMYCETMDVNRIFLAKMKNVLSLNEFDFLKVSTHNYFDRIVANPPFNKNQDIDHIMKMYDVLKQGGRLVSIASKHWQLSSNKKETEFKKWLGLVKAEIHEIEAGAFNESGTNIATCIIVINK